MMPGWIPSVESLRIQFHWMNAHVKTAQRFTGHFNVKFRVQSRMARLHHLDAQYVATRYQYLKQFVVLNWNETIMVCMDDKAVSPSGWPWYAPVYQCKTTQQRTRSNRRPWTCGNGPGLLVLSHIFKVPSVPYSHNEIIRKSSHRHILQNQKSKDYIFLFVFFKKSLCSYEFWKFQMQGPNSQFGVT